jgi:hypothetical protein
MNDAESNWLACIMIGAGLGIIVGAIILELIK